MLKMKILTPIILSGEKKRGKIIPKIILKGYLLIRGVLLALIYRRIRSIIMHIVRIERKENYSLRVVVRPYKPQTTYDSPEEKQDFLSKQLEQRY